MTGSTSESLYRKRLAAREEALGLRNPLHDPAPAQEAAGAGPIEGREDEMEASAGAEGSVVEPGADAVRPAEGPVAGAAVEAAPDGGVDSPAPPSEGGPSVEPEAAPDGGVDSSASRRRRGKAGAGKEAPGPSPEA